MKDLKSISITDVLRVIAGYTRKPFTEPTKGKRNIPCIHPQHADSTASLHVSSNDNAFFCHGACHGGGGILKAPMFFGLVHDGDKKAALTWLEEHGFLEPQTITCRKCRRDIPFGTDKCQHCGTLNRRKRPAIKKPPEPVIEPWWTDDSKLLPDAAAFRQATLDDMLHLIGLNRLNAVRREIAKIRTKRFAPFANERLLDQYTALTLASESIGIDNGILLRRTAQRMFPQLFMYNHDI